jgi:hypothetical protein
MKRNSMQALLGLLFILAGFSVRAQVYKPLHSASYVKDKNFYLFTLFDGLPAVNQAIRQQPALMAVWQKKLGALRAAAATCEEDAGCHVNALKWTDEDIATVGTALTNLHQANQPVQELVRNHLRRSGYYANYAPEGDVQLLNHAWQDAAAAMNRIMNVYALGQKPQYPDIDSASYDVRTIVYRKNINIVVNTLADFSADSVKTFYDAALHFSLDLLDINMRNEAGRLEPHAQVNASVIKTLKGIDWNKYKYTAIVVPGAGPDITSARLDPWAISRLRVAVDRFRKGEAPLFIVSGGFVKPFQTPYSEGVEMKRYLTENFGIPASKIILEPYARHTTTNIRNAVRLMAAYNIPLNRPALIITDQYQTHTIQSQAFLKRCLDELGYQPFVTLTPKGKTDTEFVPNLISLHLDARDPLDP